MLQTRRLPRTDSPLWGVPAYRFSRERLYIKKAGGLDPAAIPSSHSKWIAARHARVVTADQIPPSCRAPRDQPARIPSIPGSAQIPAEIDADGGTHITGRRCSYS